MRHPGNKTIMKPDHQGALHVSGLTHLNFGMPRKGTLDRLMFVLFGMLQECPNPQLTQSGTIICRKVEATEKRLGKTAIWKYVNGDFNVVCCISKV